jgi:hypothetical protein
MDSEAIGLKVSRSLIRDSIGRGLLQLSCHEPPGTPRNTKIRLVEISQRGPNAFGCGGLTFGLSLAVSHNRRVPILGALSVPGVYNALVRRIRAK